MTVSMASMHGVRTAGQSNLQLLVPVAIVFAATSFNLVLAFVNGHVMRLSSAHVILVELMIFAAAHAWIALNFRMSMMRWYALIGILVGFSAVRVVALGDFDPKFLRDTLVIPTFIMLGMTISVTRTLDRLVVAFALIVAAVMLWEAYAVRHFTDTFEIAEYYIATRGVSPIEFDLRGDLELSFSAIRWAGRFFDFVDWHRLSSIFVEALSLGNACMILAAYLLARWPGMTWATRIMLVLLTALLLVGSDGRRATGVIILTIPAVMMATRLPARSPVLYLPFATATLLLAVWIFEFESGIDNLPGRFAFTSELIASLKPIDWVGLSDPAFIDTVIDSGLVYLIITHSLIGTIVLWVWLIFAARVDTPEQKRMLHATAIYIATGMMITMGFLTIKTAALLWFFFGAFQNSGPVEGQSAPVEGPHGNVVRTPSVGRTQRQPAR